ncbi:hypothetical protein H4R35_002463 [Dimargaris xerosporica]|nr:hypothetical protein H4R35_002463 [Dimargaris xerosporica]
MANSTLYDDNPTLRLAIILPVIVVLNVFIIASTILYCIRARTSKDLQKRSVPLTILTGVTAVISCTLFLLRNLPQMPCFVSHLGSYFGFYFVHVALITRSVRLIAMAKTASAKVTRLIHPELPETFWEKHPQIMRVLTDDRRLILWIFVISSPIIVFAVIALIVSPYYGVNATSMDCPISWDTIPIMVISCLFVFVCFPLLLFFMRNIHDAYEMRNDLVIATAVSIVFDLIFLVTTIVAQTLPFNSLAFPAVSVVVIQVSGVFLPWYRAEKEHRNQNQLLAHTQDLFYSVINDPDMVSMFCKFCENNFCTELPFFLTDYQRLKAKSVNFMLSDKPLKHYSAGRLKEDASQDTLAATTPTSPFGKWFVTKNTNEKDTEQYAMGDLDKPHLPGDYHRISSLPHTIALDLGRLAEKSVPADLAIEYYVFYERYFSDGSAWEVNISGRTLAQLRSLVEKEQFRWTMFDAAKDEVSQLLMEDVFTKFLKANRDLIRSP